MFFFNDTATTEIYTLSLHDALPICSNGRLFEPERVGGASGLDARAASTPRRPFAGRRRSADASAAADVGSTHRASSDRKSTRLNSSHANISYAVFCLKKKKNTIKWT